MSKNKPPTTAEINRLHEHLWIALGPKRVRSRAEATRALARIMRTAETVRIRKIVDPEKAGVAGAEAGKRYRLYEDGQSVADFVLKHGDGGHVRLDAQRGCIRLVESDKRRR
jgi:hypothetical protein